MVGRETEPFYMSATGPDGAGKDTAWRIAAPQLPTELRILKIGKPTSVIIGGVQTYVQVGASKVLDRLHEEADAKRNRRLTSVVNAMYVMYQWGFQERYWRMRIKPDIVFSLRDGYADPASYAPFYMPDTLGKKSIPDRIAFLHNLHRSPFRKRTIFLDIEPSIAVVRIEQRIKSEEGGSGSIRPKWAHEHETIQGLTGIRTEFRRVLQYLETNCGTETVFIDASKHRNEVGRSLAREMLASKT